MRKYIILRNNFGGKVSNIDCSIEGFETKVFDYDAGNEFLNTFKNRLIDCTEEIELIIEQITKTEKKGKKTAE